MKSIMTDWGLSARVRVRVRTDSKAATAIALRRGLGYDQTY